MDPLKIIRKLALEIIDQKECCPDFVHQRILWAFVAGWEEGLQHCSGRKPVIQLNQYGKIINIFRSMKDAGKIPGCNITGINAVCKGRRHSCGGSHWRYVEGGKQIKKIVEGWQNKL